jgi:hypothetical protein
MILPMADKNARMPCVIHRVFLPDGCAAGNCEKHEVDL